MCTCASMLDTVIATCESVPVLMGEHTSQSRSLQLASYRQSDNWILHPLSRPQPSASVSDRYHDATLLLLL